MSEPPVAGESDRPPTLADHGWFAGAIESWSDATYVLDAATVITWTNTAGAELVGLTREAMLGRSMAEFVHPEDLVRAAEVLGLASEGVFNELPITPALYRVRDGAGNWVSVEVNASLPRADGSVLVVARPGGDLVIADRLLEAVTANVPFHQQVELVLELARWRHPAEGYAILYDDPDGTRRSITSSGLNPVLAGAAPGGGTTPWDLAVRTGEDVVIPDLAAVADGSELICGTVARRAIECDYVGCIAAGVHDDMAGTDACIVIWTTRHGPTHAGHGYALDNMRRALALVLQQRAQLVLLEQAARVDALTGLLSRAGFFDLIERDATGFLAEGFAVLYVDLDGFKSVNDSHGHSVGDAVLVAAARRLLHLAPAEAIAARLGGDEFVLVCPSAAAPTTPAALAQRIVDALATPIEAPVGEVRIGASVGVATGRGSAATQDVLDAADAALLEAKARGRSRWVAA